MKKKVNTRDKMVSNIILYKEVFDHEKGIKCLLDLCKKIQYFQSSYRGEATALDCVFREGQRNVIHLILSTINQNPSILLEEFRKLEQEELDYE